MTTIGRILDVANPLGSSPAARRTGSASAPSRSIAPRARGALAKVIATTRDAGATVARLALGLVMFPHGAQHGLGLFGGYGFSGTLGWMTKTLGFPAPLAAIAIIVELLAPIALVAGLAGRLAALGMTGLMLGAISTHVPNGFFMNWFGS